MSTTKFLACAGGLAILASIAGCADPGERDANWDFIHAAIIEPSCATASCHSSLSKTAGVNLEDVDEAYDFLVSENDEPGFVIPMDENSALLYLLNGNERKLMPPDGPLPKADIDLIKEWISQGAER